MTRRTRLALAAALALISVSAILPSVAWGQETARPVSVRQAPGPQIVRVAPPAGEPVAGPFNDFNAEQTRQELSDLLDKYPPSLGRVLKLDPSLLTSETYLASYPALAAFLAQHPEVSRSPAYFLERIAANNWEYRPDPESVRRREMAQIFAGFAAFIVFLIVTGVIVWTIRTIIDHRRWNKVSKTQFDVHSKLLERMTTNDELLAYIQTPVGRRFLESGPAPLPGEPRPVAAPFSRILWSVQVGVVLVAAGAGLLILSSRLADEFSVFFVVFGGVTLALGVGFIASGGVAYGLSRRLGLLDPPDADHA